MQNIALNFAVNALACLLLLLRHRDARHPVRRSYRSFFRSFLRLFAIALALCAAPSRQSLAQTASFLGADSASQGNWKGNYGRDYRTRSK